MNEKMKHREICIYGGKKNGNAKEPISPLCTEYYYLYRIFTGSNIHLEWNRERCDFRRGAFSSFQ
jgi:hypothetical protein